MLLEAARLHNAGVRRRFGVVDEYTNPWQIPPPRV